MTNNYKYGNINIDRQREATSRFCSDTKRDLYFHIRSYYPGLDGQVSDAFDVDPIVQKVIESNIEKYEQIEKIIPNHFSGLAFDAGCGNCSLPWRMKDKFSWIGGDFNFNQLMQGKKYLGKKMCPSVQLDLYHLPFKDCSYDMITNIDVIEHIDDQEQVINEFIRILKPGGYLLIHTDNVFRILLALIVRRLTQICKGQYPDWQPAWHGVEHGHNQLLSMGRLKKMLLSSGLELVKAEYLDPVIYGLIRAKFFYCLSVKKKSNNLL